MRSVPALCARAFALAVVLLGASVFVGPSCSIFQNGQDCQDGCNTLKMCGLIQTSDCGLYCAGLTEGVTIAGCADKFDAQNTCAKANTNCNTANANCAQETEAFTKCMRDYCNMNPMGSGCPDIGDGGGGGGTGGGTTGDAG
jgi:hypothetical protein